MLGSQGPCSACSSATALQHFLQPWTVDDGVDGGVDGDYVDDDDGDHVDDVDVEDDDDDEGHHHEDYDDDSDDGNLEPYCRSTDSRFLDPGGPRNLPRLFNPPSI